VISGDEVDRGPESSTVSTVSLSKNHKSFTRRASAVPPVTPTYKTVVTKINDTDITMVGKSKFTSELWMQTVTPGQAQFSNFQTKVFIIVQQIVRKPEHAKHPFTIKWQKLCSSLHKQPMTASIKWRSLKVLLGIGDIFDYKDFLLKCPDIGEYIKFTSSKTTKNGLDYGLYEKAHDDARIPSSSPSIESPSTLDTQSFELDFSDDKPPAVKEEAISSNIDDQSSETRSNNDEPKGNNDTLVLTPKHTNVQSLPQVVSVVTGAKEDTSLILIDPPKESDVPEESEIAWMPDDESPGFRQVHYRLFESITTWYQQAEATTHPFHMKWRKALYLGLVATTPWKTVAKILKLENVKDYIAYMNECPRIQERYDLKWDYFDNAIRYVELELPELEDLNQDIGNLNKFQRHLNGMVLRFDGMIKDVEKRVDAMMARTSACEENILQKVSTRLANTVTQHMTNILAYATTTKQRFKTDVQYVNDQQLILYSEHIANIHKNSYDRMATQIEMLEKKLKEQAELLETKFYQNFDQTMEVGIQELHDCADDVTAKFKEHVDDITTALAQPVQTAQPTFAPRHPSFQNVDPAYAAKVMNYVPSPNPYQQPDHNGSSESQGMENSATQFEQLPQSESVKNEDVQWGKDGPAYQPAPSRAPTAYNWYPGQNQTYNAPADGLPIVQHNDFLKRVSLPYPGREQSYTWYLQLKSASQQYGIYLITMDQLKKDKSLCPTEFHGIVIKPSRYHEMKNSIYQYLAQPSIISIEHYDIRNIINRNALNTDGYRVLYDIMARIHPALDPDATFNIPIIGDYADIHEYYLYMDSYLMHEQFAGRRYSPRDRLNLFLRGLGNKYQVAITRAKQLMDGRSANDTTVPEILELPNLPNLIEKYMEDHDGGKAIVRRMQSAPQRHHRTSDRQSVLKADSTNRMYQDIKCPLCQTYGHHQTQCDKMAIWLNMRAAFKSVDEKLRAAIIANYAKVDADRRKKKLARLKGTVRQLYNEGQFQAGEQLLETYMGECMRDIEQYAQSQELWNPSDHTLAYDSEPSDVE
jgi:hypothetical protein